MFAFRLYTIHTIPMALFNNKRSLDPKIRSLLILFLLFPLIITIIVVTAVAPYRLRTKASLNKHEIWFEQAYANNTISSINLLIDQGINKIVFARIKILYNTSQIKLKSHPTLTPTFSTIIYRTALTKANTSGIYTLVVAVPPEQIPYGGLLKFGNFTFIPSNANVKTASVNLSIQDCQLVDEGATILPASTKTFSLNFSNPLLQVTLSPSMKAGNL